MSTGNSDCPSTFDILSNRIPRDIVAPHTTSFGVGKLSPIRQVGEYNRICIACSGSIGGELLVAIFVALALQLSEMNV